MMLSRSAPLHCGAAPRKGRRPARLVMLAGLLAIAAVLGAFVPPPAAAQARTDAAEMLEAARKDLEAVKAAGDPASGGTDAQNLRKRALSVQARALEAAAAMAPELTAVQARLSELGAVEPGVKESADVAAQRAQLLRTVSALDSQIKLARLVAIEAEQAAATASANRRLQLNARLEERAAPVVGPAFWRQLALEAPGDLRRLGELAANLRSAVDSVAPWTWVLITLLAGAVLAMAPAALRLLLKSIVARAPQGRLRRSLFAVGVIAAWTLAPGVIVHLLALGLDAGRAVPVEITRLLDNVEAVAWFAGYAAGLGSALLMAGRPSWRLPPIADRSASRLRWLPAAFAAAILLGWLSSRVALSIDASPASTAALSGLTCLTFIALFACALLQLPRAKGDAATAAPTPAEAPGEAQPQTEAAGLWFPVLRGLAWVALLISLLVSLAGYLALGNFIVGQLVWGGIVLGTAYVLAVLVDDLFMAMLAPTVLPPSAETVTAAADADDPKVAPRTREHTAVMLSGLSRIFIGLLSVVLLMAPYGEGPSDLFRRASNIGSGIHIGEVSVHPWALVQACLVLAVGLLLVRLLKRWLTQRYLPTTRMDAGMQTSLTTLTGYVGAVVVVALSISAIGVGLERVAWVASALSVGIGFGLQAVVQNFVSGLILLAERPVKVGDWVSLAGIEGDIRRINVRATEIQMGDRSTVIVPNSEFITKIVRNVTYTNPLGMVQLKLPMPLSTDTRAAKAVLLEALRTHPGVLASPAPSVQLDGIDGGNLVFVVTGFVSSPRAAYGVRSELLFDILERLREADLPLGKAPTVMLTPMAELEKRVNDGRPAATPPGAAPPLPAA